MENLIKLKPRIFAHCSLFRARSFNCNHKKWPCLSARPGNPIIQPERRISTWISTGALSNCEDLDFDKTFPPMRYRVHPDKSLRCFATSDVAYTHIYTLAKQRNFRMPGIAEETDGANSSSETRLRCDCKSALLPRSIAWRAWR